MLLSETNEYSSTLADCIAELQTSLSATKLFDNTLREERNRRGHTNGPCYGGEE